MPPLNIILVGCGMMGARHLRGYGELERAQPNAVRLRGICDLRPEFAEQVAGEAEQILGYRPAIYERPEDALAQEPEIEAADVVTGNRSHDAVVIPLLEAGLDILLEKPLAVTVARGRRIIEVARKADRILAVAENNRRDPMNRLMRHIIGSGFIGTPNFVLQTNIAAGRRMIASPWRHSMATGGLALDVGIHQAYVLEMLLGPIKTVYAKSQQIWPTRPWSRSGEPAQEMPVESDDVFAATVTFESGAQGMWTLYFGSTGFATWQRVIFGDRGTAEGPSDRSGKPVRVQLGSDLLSEEALIEALPDFHLNEIESRLFGERPGGYAFEGPETDRKLIAAELADFVDAVRERREPEVPGELGLRAVAIVYAVLESSACGEPVGIQDVLDGKIHGVQDDVERGDTVE